MVSEEIKYEVLYELEDDVEIRQYGQMTVISTAANDSDDAFSSLESYISGNNRENLIINMTFPVLSSKEDSLVNMSFVLPDGYDAGNVSAPGNNAISIHSIPARKVAAITFSGYADDEAFEKNRDILSSQLDEHGIVTKGNFFLMRYNPPWVPSSLMRNEVAVEVE